MFVDDVMLEDMRYDMFKSDSVSPFTSPEIEDEQPVTFGDVP